MPTTSDTLVFQSPLLIAAKTDSAAPAPSDSALLASPTQEGAWLSPMSSPIDSLASEEPSVAQALFPFSNESTKAIDALKHKKEEVKKQTILVNIDGTPLKERVQSHFWFTPCLFIIFTLYAFSLAIRKKTLTKEINNLFSPTSSGDTSKLTPIDEFQEMLPLLILSAANMAWVAYFFEETFSTITTVPSLAWIFSILAICVTLCLQLMLTQGVCYVFFDNETFHKLEKMKLLFFSLCGIVLIPSVLMLAYSPSFLIKPALYLGIGAVGLLFAFYLFRASSFFFKGTFSIFYLILYLCTIEILPAIALIIELERII